MLTSALPTAAANDTTPAAPPAGTVVRHRGEHSGSRRTSAEIARCLRADIRDAQKAGGLPAFKASITSDRYSMGQSVTVRITAASFRVLNPARVQWERENPNGLYAEAPARHTPRACQVLARLEALAAEYIRSETESASDLHNTNCHLSVGYDSDLENAERAALAESTAGR